MAKYGANSLRAKTITNSIANFIIKDLRPYRIVESKEFKDMLKTLDSRYTVPGRKTFSYKIIPDKYREVKQEVIASLSKAEQVALTSDGWTSRATQSYVTITSTHISQNLELVNYVLQTRSMPESHTGENIADCLQQALKEWNIPDSPLYLVSDNAANMKKAGQLLECDLHLGCYAHTLNLAAQKALGVKAVSNILARVRRASILKSQAKLFELNYTRLIIDVCTRWNSAYDMLQRYLLMQVSVVAALMNKDLKHKDKELKVLSDDETHLAECVVETLKPLKAVTTTLCSEKTPTLSIILPLHRKLLDSYLTPAEGDLPSIVSMKALIANDLKTRYTDEQQYNMLLKATALDPRFKTLPFLSENDRFEVFNKIVQDVSVMNEKPVSVKTEPVDETTRQLPELPSLPLPAPPNDTDYHNEIIKVTDSEEAVATAPHSKKPKTDESLTLNELLGDVYVTKVEPPKSKLQRAELEVSLYKECPGIPLTSNPLLWWAENEHSFPLLSRLAKHILCIPGTSVPSERVFSSTGDIVSAQRANLKPRHVDMLIFLKKNMKT
ncbi:hypothetical protein KUTeg_018759 [Tegillarca granosa]|uniref:HAT C-terminal dimerisation domain-containing protein n=1 Tax=Tegillarca granosa TaxID=220873 RepID=A0ABQ9EE82_TEGGR|nr:hypothetical protein KUTeg_018759 [Tegillarca granosa]